MPKDDRLNRINPAPRRLLSRHLVSWTLAPLLPADPTPSPVPDAGPSLHHGAGSSRAAGAAGGWGLYSTSGLLGGYIAQGVGVMGL